MCGCTKERAFISFLIFKIILQEVIMGLPGNSKVGLNKPI